MCVLLLGARHFFLYGQDKSGFPDGFDAVQAAPGSHKVIFENEFIRVLQVTLPPAGHAEPMHFHRLAESLHWLRHGRHDGAHPLSRSGR